MNEYGYLLSCVFRQSVSYITIPPALRPAPPFPVKHKYMYRALAPGVIIFYRRAVKRIGYPVFLFAAVV